MSKIIFATSNPDKMQIATSVCSTFDIKVEFVRLDIDEIQGEDAEVIVRNKAKRAYDQLNMPVVVSDDSWDIKALNGFPGAYMKSINYWFKPEDFIRLMSSIKDRRVTLHQYLAYTDGNITEVFTNDLNGVIVSKPRGKVERAPCMEVVEFDFDEGLTLAEVFNKQDDQLMAKRYRKHPDAWHEFAKWYKSTAR